MVFLLQSLKQKDQSKLETAKPEHSIPIEITDKSYSKPQSSLKSARSLSGIFSKKKPKQLPIWKVTESQNGTRYVAQEILIGFVPQTSISDVQFWALNYNLHLNDYNPMSGLAHFKIGQPKLKVPMLIEILANDRSQIVLFSEPNYVLKLSRDLPDDYNRLLWYIKNDGAPLNASSDNQSSGSAALEIEKKPHADIAGGKIEQAWDIQSGGPVVVAVADTGVDIYHPDLTELKIEDGKIVVKHTNIWQNPNEIADNGVDDDNNGFIDDTMGWDFTLDDNNPSPDLDFDTWIEDNADENLKDLLREQLKTGRIALEKDASHGTHIAGVISAISNNGSGITAIAQHDVKVMPLKMGGIRLIEVKNEQTEEISHELSYALTSAVQVVELIDYAKRNGAHIFNASWGTSGKSRTLQSAIENARGMLFVAAAGNAGQDNDENPYYPSSFQLSHLISVAASGTTDEITSFSNFGKNSVDIAVPGRLIRSLKASPRDVADPLTFEKNELVDMSGTSMSAGLLSAVASLIFLELQVQRETFEAGEIKHSLMQSVRLSDSFKGKVKSEGIVDMYNALNGLRNNSLQPFTPEEVFNDIGNQPPQDAQQTAKIDSSSGCGITQTPHQTPFGKGLDLSILFLFSIILLRRFRRLKEIL